MACSSAISRRKASRSSPKRKLWPLKNSFVAAAAVSTACFRRMPIVSISALNLASISCAARVISSVRIGASAATDRIPSTPLFRSTSKRGPAVSPNSCTAIAARSAWPSTPCKAAEVSKNRVSASLTFPFVSLICSPSSEIAAAAGPPPSEAKRPIRCCKMARASAISRAEPPLCSAANCSRCSASAVIPILSAVFWRLAPSATMALKPLTRVPTSESAPNTPNDLRATCPTAAKRCETRLSSRSTLWLNCRRSRCASSSPDLSSCRFASKRRTSSANSSCANVPTPYKFCFERLRRLRRPASSSRLHPHVSAALGRLRNSLSVGTHYLLPTEHQKTR